MKKVWEFISKASHSRTTAVLVILILFASVPLTVFVAQQRQQTQQHAAACTGGGDFLYCSGTTICVEHGDCTYSCATCPNGGTCQGTGTSIACSSGVPTVTPTASVTPTTPPTTTTPVPSPGTPCPQGDGIHSCMQSCPSGAAPNNAYSCATIGNGIGYCCQGNGYACPGNALSSGLNTTGAGSQYTCRSTGCNSNEVYVSDAGSAICTIDYGQSAVCCTASSSSPAAPTATVAPTTTNCTTGQSYCKNIGAPDTNCTLWNYANCQACLPLQLVACTPAGPAAPAVTAAVTGNVALALTIGLDGVGNTGDRVTTLNNLSNKNPTPTSRQFTIAILDSSKNVVAGSSATPSLTYNSTSGKFEGSVTISTIIPAGTYTIGVNSAGHLRANAGQLIVNSSTTASNPTAAFTDLIAGDIDGSTIIDVMDYNILKSCSKFSTDNHGACGSFSQAADLNLDGPVDQLDYNLWAREFSVSIARQGY